MPESWLDSPAPLAPRLISAFAEDADMSLLVERFVGKLAEKRSAIVAAAQSEDSAPLHRLAHQLKGTGGSYGFPSITVAAAAVEAAIAILASRAEIGRTVQALLELLDRAQAPAT